VEVATEMTEERAMPGIDVVWAPGEIAATNASADRAMELEKGQAAAADREEEIGYRLGLLADLEDRRDLEAREEERRVRAELETLEAAEAADLADEWDRPALRWCEAGPEAMP
jgi:hypothetical protein